MNDIITILLATYNGGQYLSHQLDSIVNQTYSNWHLIIRDDHSTDNTTAVIEQYRQAYSGKIDVLKNTGNNTGSVANFSALLSAVKDADYIMFCDQDDEWKKDKIEVTFAEMRRLEKQYGKAYPLMIFTNFQYVNAELQIIESKKNFDINRIKDFGFAHLLAQNPVYGCTTMINRPLADMAGVIPPEADYHDHWIALVAAAFGKLSYLSEKTVLYRQHATNVSGNFDNNSFTKRFQRIFVNKKNYKAAQSKYIMLLYFNKTYANKLDKKFKCMLNDFLSLFTYKHPSCIIRNIKNGVRSQTLAQSLLLYTTIYFTKMPAQPGV